MYKKGSLFLSIMFVFLAAAVGISQYLILYGILPASDLPGEGGRINSAESSLYSPSGYMGLKTSDVGIKILKNGFPAQAEEENGDVKIFKVNDGDVFTADTRNNEDGGVIYVYNATENISFPKAGTKLYVKEPVKKIFTVRVENSR